LLLLLLF
jgi:hypothetical protein